MSMAVPVCKRKTLRTIARSPKKRHQNTATKPATAVVKEENVKDATEDAESWHPLPEAVAVQEGLLQ